MWQCIFLLLTLVLLKNHGANCQEHPIGAIVRAHDCAKEGSEYTTLDITRVLSCDQNVATETWKAVPVQLVQRRVTRKVTVNRCLVERQR